MEATYLSASYLQMPSKKGSQKVSEVVPGYLEDCGTK